MDDESDGYDLPFWLTRSAIHIRENGRVRNLTLDERIYLRGYHVRWWFHRSVRLPGQTTTWRWL